MASPRLSVCLIVRDNAEYIERCLDSIAVAADEYVIVDTGSTDGTQDVVRRYCTSKGKALQLLDFNPRTHPDDFLLDVATTWDDDEILKPYTGQSILANFGDARQLGWGRAEGTYRIWLDSDDVVEGAEKIPALLDEMERAGHQIAFLDYHYAFNSQGQVICNVRRERIVKRGAPTNWTQPIHEVLCPLVDVGQYFSVVVAHRHRNKATTLKPIASRNLKVLYKRGDRADARVLFYTGMEEYYIAPQRALKTLGLYVEKSGWGEERAQAHMFMGCIHEREGDYRQAYAHFSQAAADHDNPEAFFGLARIRYYANDWGHCAALTEKGLAIPQEKTVASFMHDPTERRLRPYVYVSRAYAEMGDWEKTLAACDRGMEWEPDNPYLKGNRELALRSLARDGKPAASEPTTSPAGTPRTESAEVVRRDELDIVIWTGNAWEKWSPLSIDRGGIGGSETAAVKMAQYLRQLGHRVRVVSDCQDQAGEYDGVIYLDYREFERNPESLVCDILVVSRQAWVLNYKLKARKKYLWVHDIHVGDTTAEVLGQAERIFCLSNWHREFFLGTYPWLAREKVVVTRNGIDLPRFAKEPVKIGNRIVYGSSPDRGLSRLLALFPRIRNEVKDAELHVYYGFDNWEKMAKGNPVQLAEIERLRNLLHTTPGVHTHGRVSQQELADAYLSAKVWAYPTWFSETSCITAMECQAAGCVPVTTSLAALSETVRSGVLIQPPENSDNYQDVFVQHVAGMLKNEELRGTVARQGREIAMKSFGWPTVAAEWTIMFAHALHPLTMPLYEGD